MARPLPFRRRGEGRRGELVRREAGVRRTAEHLGHDAGEGLGAAALGRAIGDVRAGAMAARDVSGIRQAAIDGADRVRIDAQGPAELADRGQPRPGQEPPGVDLVGELPVDLGGDRDVGIALDVERATGGSVEGVGSAGSSGHLVQSTIVIRSLTYCASPSKVRLGLVHYNN